MRNFLSLLYTQLLRLPSPSVTVSVSQLATDWKRLRRLSRVYLLIYALSLTLLLMRIQQINTVKAGDHVGILARFRCRAA